MGRNSRRVLGLDYSESQHLFERLEQLNGNIKNTAEKALKNSQQYVTRNIHHEMQKHKRTGKTEASIVDNPDIFWVTGKAKIDVGFKISNGGLPSIFLMYGTKVYGTPRVKKDQKLYNAIYGRRTKKEVIEIQKDVFFDEIRRLGG